MQLRKFFGMEIIRDRKSVKLYLSQKGYIEKVLHRFNMHNAKPVSTPLATHFKLSSALCPVSEDDIKYISRVPYSSAVGSLMYTMVCSRPDLSHGLSVVSTYMANPGKEHWNIVQWFSDICVVPPMLVYSLENLETDLLAMLILIMLVI